MADFIASVTEELEELQRNLVSQHTRILDRLRAKHEQLTTEGVETAIASYLEQQEHPCEAEEQKCDTPVGHPGEGEVPPSSHLPAVGFTSSILSHEVQNCESTSLGRQPNHLPAVGLTQSMLMGTHDVRSIRSLSHRRASVEDVMCHPRRKVASSVGRIMEQELLDAHSIELDDRAGKMSVQDLVELIAQLSQKLPEAHSLQQAESRRSIMHEHRASRQLPASTRKLSKLGEQPTLAGEQQLRIYIIGASDLRDADWGVGFGTSDPYCTCQVIDEDEGISMKGSEGVAEAKPALRTRTISNTLNPSWNHTEILNSVTRNDILRFRVYDSDPGKTDDFLGFADVSGDEIFSGGFHGSLPLQGPDALGELMVRIDVELDDSAEFDAMCKESLSKWSKHPGANERISLRGHFRGSTLNSLDIFPKHGDQRWHSDTGSYLQKCILSPFSTLRWVWNFSSMMALLMDAFMIPLLFSFGDPPSFNSLPLRCVVATFWALDIGLNFFTGIQTEGILDLRPRQIACHYAKTWLVMDLAITVLDWSFIIVAAIQEMASGSAGGGLARVSKLSRGLRVIRLASMVRLGKFQAVVDNMISTVHKEVTAIFCRLIEYLVVVIISTHFVACIWYSLGTRPGVDISWVEAGRFTESSYWHRYFASFHWAITQFTPASCDVHPVEETERIFTVFVDLLGLIGFSTFISGITATMTQLRQVSQAYNTDVKSVKSFFTHNCVSVPLGCRIMGFLKHSYGLANTPRTSADSIKPLRNLPADLRVQLDFELCLRVLAKHPLFKALNFVEESVMFQLASVGLKERLLVPDDVLFRKHEVGLHMWFIAFGRMSYQRGASKLTVAVDSWVCEATLWIPDWHHRGDFFALEQSNVVGLESSGFATIMEQLSHSRKMQREVVATWLRKYAVRFISEHARSQEGEVYMDSSFLLTDVWGDYAYIMDILREVTNKRQNVGDWSRVIAMLNERIPRGPVAGLRSHW